MGWIDNYDDPPDMPWEEALALLEANHFGFVESPVGYLITPPNGEETFYTEDEQDQVIDYVIGWGLTWPSVEEEEQEATREERQTLAFLKIALDEDRLSDRPLFPEGYDDEEAKQGERPDAV